MKENEIAPTLIFTALVGLFIAILPPKDKVMVGKVIVDALKDLASQKQSKEIDTYEFPSEIDVGS